MSTNICGSDQHMVRGRTTAPAGLVLGHEITGEVIEVGPGVEFIEVGDLCSVPFNIACGRCRNGKEGGAAVDAVGFEARGHGKDAGETPATVLNSLMDVSRAAGAIGIPGLHVTEDPGASDEAVRQGSLSLKLGTGWAKSLSFTTGQCPVMRPHRGLMHAIRNDRAPIAKAVNATVISLDEAPQGDADFDQGAAQKFVLDPNGLIPA